MKRKYQLQKPKRDYIYLLVRPFHNCTLLTKKLKWHRWLTFAQSFPTNSIYHQLSFLVAWIVPCRDIHRQTIAREPSEISRNEQPRSVLGGDMCPEFHGTFGCSDLVFPLDRLTKPRRNTSHRPERISRRGSKTGRSDLLHLANQHSLT